MYVCRYVVCRCVCRYIRYIYVSRVLPCVAVCVLQCVCCSVSVAVLLQCDIQNHHTTRPWCHCLLQCVAVCCSVLQCVAVCCSALRCAAVCYSVCNMLQCVAVCLFGACLWCVCLFCALQCVAVY